ncbi:MAG: hypothetical protein AB8E82_06330 [Aureispira sp.]
MNQLLKFNQLPFIPLVFLLTSYCFIACQGTSNLGNPEVSQRKGTEVDNMLLYGKDVTAPSTYRDVKGNIPRLKAMISGRFVQYNTVGDTKRKKYSVWKVNGGKDSVVIYQLPVGEPNKDGHWVYHYQFMTSLPNDPVYTAFSKMTEINRDSIVAVYYEVPDDFKTTIPEIIAEPQKAFKDFEFKRLKLSKTGEKVYYNRKTPLNYYGVSRWMNTTSKNPERKGGYDADYYIVTPNKYFFGKVLYSKDRKYLGPTVQDYLVKEARVKSEWISR